MRGERRPLVHLLALAALLAAWEILVRAGRVDGFYAGRPTQVAAALAALWREGALRAHALSSLRNLAAGYGLGVCAGAAAGLVLGHHRRLYDALGSYARLLSTVPQLVLIPFFILWFGIGDQAKIAIVFVMTFFPVLIAGMDAARCVPRELLDVCAVYGAGHWLTLAWVVLPSSAEALFTGARVAVSRAVAGMILGETFGRAEGLGYLLFRYGLEYSVNRMLAVLLVIMALSLGLFRALGLLEAGLVRWRR